MDEIAQKLHRDRDEILQFCSSHKRIHLYGAGAAGGLMLRYLIEEKIEVRDILVSSMDGENRSFMGMPVKEIKREVLEEGDGIIVSVGSRLQREIFEHLKGFEIKEEDIYLQRIYPLLFHKPLSKPNLDLLPETNAKGFFKDYTELDCLGQKNATDKSSDYHNYLNKYDFFLKGFKDEPVHVLELGVFNGSSLRMWEEYFTKAQIYGVDIEESCRRYEGGRRHVIIQDLGEERLLEQLSAAEPSVIIDDASHYTSHQIKALYHLFPALRAGGVYIVEDLGTNFNTYADRGYQDSIVSCYEFCKAAADVVTSGEKLEIERMHPACVPLKKEIESLAEQMEMISFLNESCIMVKK